MTDWKPTIEPRTCAMRFDPYTPVRVLAVDLPGEYPVVYHNGRTDSVRRVRADGKVYASPTHTSPGDLVPYRPKTIEAWAVVKNGEVLATTPDRASADMYCLTRDVEDAELVRLTPAKWFD